MIVRTFLIIGFLLVLGGCSSDDEGSSSMQNCGCNNKETISNNKGTIFYRAGNSQYSNRYWIESPLDCGSVCSFLILCNDEKLSKELKGLSQDLNTSINVEFSGSVRNICREVDITLTHEYKRIYINSINKL